MKRRNFLSTVGAAVALPALLNTRVARTSPFYEIMAAGSPEDNENILILIQMNGGNDGLNTLVPLDQYDNLARARTDVVVPENEVIKLYDDVGLHPTMTHVADAYQNERLGIVQGVGYPEPNQSHFRSTDIWTSGSGSDKYESSGWIGRYLAKYHPEFPENYPTTQFPDPLSLTIGTTVSTTCQGQIHTMGMAFNNFDDVYNLKSLDDESIDDTFAQSHINYINNLIEQTNIYTKTLEAARDRGEGSVNADRYPDTAFGNRMKTVAHLINGGLKTKVYVVTLGGFDTHAGQVDEEGSSVGMHGYLLEQISHAMDGAYKDLKDSGNSGKVLFMTFSEFGRRIAQNASLGTDHGTSAPMFFMGEKVNPIIHGVNPDIPANATNQDNLAMQFDYRSVYYSILKDWFDVPDPDFDDIMLSGHNHIPIIKQTDTSVQDRVYDSTLNIYPNPATDVVNISSTRSIVPGYISDLNGRKLLNANGKMQINVSRLPKGQYIISDISGVPIGRFIKK
jgi:uncharacterized protein (DUF1501 family)